MGISWHVCSGQSQRDVGDAVLRQQGALNFDEPVHEREPQSVRVGRQDDRLDHTGAKRSRPVQPLRIEFRAKTMPAVSGEHSGPRRRASPPAPTARSGAADVLLALQGGRLRRDRRGWVQPLGREPGGGLRSPAQGGDLAEQLTRSMSKARYSAFSELLAGCSYTTLGRSSSERAGRTCPDRFDR